MDLALYCQGLTLISWQNYKNYSELSKPQLQTMKFQLHGF